MISFSESSSNQYSESTNPFEGCPAEMKEGEELTERGREREREKYSFKKGKGPQWGACSTISARHRPLASSPLLHFFEESKSLFFFFILK